MWVFLIHYAGHTLYSAKQETHVLQFWAFLCIISFIISSPPLFFFFFSGSLSRNIYDLSLGTIL